MSSPQTDIQILPFSRIVGQDDLKLALEIAYVAPRIGGVLLSGQRGTGKSTAVRAFAAMVYDGKLPVTLPINATEDRVVGGWRIDELMRGKPVEQVGLLEKANKGLLYVDEVNLLDDHIVNIILDVTSTGVLVVEREGKEKQMEVRFTLVGTMNPEEGGLRPQLLDRFGLMVDIETKTERRAEILQTILEYDAALANSTSDHPDPWLLKAREEDVQRKATLITAQHIFRQLTVSPEIVQRCVDVAMHFQAEGHRGEYVMALAARSCAALQAAELQAAKPGSSISAVVTTEHIKKVARLALQHRRRGIEENGYESWSLADDEIVMKTLGNDTRSFSRP